MFQTIILGFHKNLRILSRVTLRITLLQSRIRVESTEKNCTLTDNFSFFLLAFKFKFAQ